MAQAVREAHKVTADPVHPGHPAEAHSAAEEAAVLQPVLRAHGDQRVAEGEGAEVVAVGVVKLCQMKLNNGLTYELNFALFEMF